MAGNKLKPSPCTYCKRRRKCTRAKECETWRSWLGRCWGTVQKQLLGKEKMNNLRNNARRKELHADATRLMDLADFFKSSFFKGDDGSESWYEDAAVCERAAALLEALAESGTPCAR